MEKYRSEYEEFDVDREASIRAHYEAWAEREKPFAPEIFLIPLTPEGDKFREKLLQDQEYIQYGYKEKDFNHNKRDYKMIIINQKLEP